MTTYKNNSKLCSIAESVKAEILYDIMLTFTPVEFYRQKFQKDRYDEKILCNIIYKYDNA